MKLTSYFKLSLDILSFSGEKAAQLLHGQVTNDIRGLQDGFANLNLLLSQKGKVRAVFHVLCRKKQYEILCEKTDSDMLLDHFSRIAPLSRVEINRQSQSFVFYHILGQLESLDKYQLCTAKFGSLDLSALRTDRLGVLGWDIFVPVSEEELLLSYFEEKETRLLPFLEQEGIRISNGIPKFGVDFNGDHLPQECLLDEALNFNKGCYLGQEIIARLHFKGHVNKLLKPLKISGCIPHVGDVLCDQGVEVGKLTSVAASDFDNIFSALGFLPYRKSEVGQVFSCGESGHAVII
jgi:folate-binding protein YgfZ